MFRRKPRIFRAEDDILDWFTISYASILSVVGGLLLLAGAGGAYLYFKDRPASGFLLRAPTRARFSWFEGVVKVKAAGAADWVMASAELALARHDLVRTLPGAAAEIAFFDGTLVLLRPDSLVSIEETGEDSASRRRVAWHITSGEVQLKTGPGDAPDRSTEVSTPTAEGRVGGSSLAAVRVAETGASEFRMFEGAGRVTTKTGQQVELGAAQALRVSAEGQLTAKVALPSPPVLRPTEQEGVVRSEASGATARLAWRPEPSAVAYRVMVDHNAAFAWPLVDRKGIKESAIELRGLDPGRYYWRVAALGRDDLEGAFSEYSRLHVIRGRPGAQLKAPPLWLDSVEVRGRIAQVKGRTEPFARVIINGQKAEVQADGSFNEFVILLAQTEQEIVIQAHGTDGGMAEQRRAVTLPVS
ncbi:MAG TPA: FecR domain-containing protein [Vicinamibacteria bacterium]|nr:FecR domain-containing protein [Vicinamibacteria bacterium]